MPVARSVRGGLNNGMESPAPTVVIFVALAEEYSAAKRHILEPKEVEIDGLRTEVGYFVGEKQRWRVVLRETGMGNEGAAADVARLLAAVKPDCAFFVGIAGGLKDLGPGDVVAGELVITYDYTKEESTPRPRGRSYAPHPVLLDRARSVARGVQWHERLADRATQPRAIVKRIASGNKVLASLDSAVVALLRSQYGDCVAVEMEGAGFADACERRDTPALAVRGISDLVAGKEEADKKGVRYDAADAAAAFAFEVLSEGGPPRQTAAAEAVAALASQPSKLAPLLEALAAVAQSAAGRESSISGWLRDRPVRLPERILPRPSVVAEGVEAASSSSWINIWAPLARGATTTAALLCRALRVERVEWIRAYGRNIDTDHLRRQLTLITQSSSGPDGSVFEGAARELGRGSVLVLDGLPNLSVDLGLAADVQELHRALAQSGSLLISTSRQRLPSDLSRFQGIVDLEVPGVSVPEIRETVDALSLPCELDRRVLAEAVHGVTGGDPALVMEVVRFLELNLDFKVEALLALVTGAVSANLRTETRKRLPGIVSDVIDRELLARLSLAGIEVHEKVVSAVATVEPRIHNYRDRLLAMSPQVVIQASDKAFELSPLLRGLGEELLDDSVKSGVHLAIARTIVARKPLAPEDVDLAISHLVMGGGLREASALLLMAATEVKEPEFARALVSRKLAFDRLPMPRADQLAIKASQLRLRGLAGDEVRDDLTAFLTDLAINPADALPTYLALTIAGPFNKAAPPVEAAKAALQASRLTADLPAEVWPENPPFEPEALFVLPASRAETVEEINGILGLARIMTSTERTVIFETLDASLPDLLVAKIVGLEAAKPEEGQHWEAVLAVLSQLKNLGELEGAEILAVVAARWRALVLVDYVQNPAAAMEELSSAKATKPLSKFLLQLTEAIVLEIIGRLEEAAQRLGGALALAVPDDDSRADVAYRMGVLRAMLGDWPAAREAQLLALTTASREDPMQTRLKALGELAYVQWMMGRRHLALGSMAGLSNRLQASREGSTDRVWRATAQALGWYATMAETGRPPRVDGPEPYMEPFPGLFSKDVAMGAPRSQAYLSTLLSRWALAEGHVETARLYAESALSQAGYEGFPNIAVVAIIYKGYAAVDRGDVTMAYAAFREFLEGARTVPGPEGLFTRGEASRREAISASLLLEISFWQVVIPLLANALVPVRAGPAVARTAIEIRDQVELLSAHDGAYGIDIREDLSVGFIDGDLERIRGRLSGCKDRARIALLSLATVATSTSLVESTAALIMTVGVWLSAGMGRFPPGLLRLVIRQRDTLLGNLFRLRMPQRFAVATESLPLKTGRDAALVLMAAAEALEIEIPTSYLRPLQEAAGAVE